MFKRILKRTALFYAASLAVTGILIPRTMYEAFRENPASTLLAPLILPLIIPVTARSYWQFVGAGVWPYSYDPNVISVSDLIDRQGHNGEIEIDTTPELSPGKEGRLLHLVSMESFGTLRTGAFYEIPPQGFVVKIGQYFCLSEPSWSLVSKALARVKCVRLFQKSGDVYEWRELGQSGGQLVVVRSAKP